MCIHILSISDFFSLESFWLTLVTKNFKFQTFYGLTFNYSWNYRLILISPSNHDIEVIIHVFKRNQQQSVCDRGFAPVLVFIHFHLGIYLNPKAIHRYYIENTLAFPSRLWQIIDNRNYSMYKWLFEHCKMICWVG